MKRREFIAGLGGAAAWPVVARAQQIGPMRRIGVLIANAEGDSQAQSGLAKFTMPWSTVGSPAKGGQAACVAFASW